MQPSFHFLGLWLVPTFLRACRASSASALPHGGVRRSLGPLCNGHAELCDRRYSNVTYVAAHNSPFNKFGNPGSNQAESVETQLNDGVRMRTQTPSLGGLPLPLQVYID